MTCGPTLASSVIEAVLAGERTQGFEIHTQAGLDSLAVLLRQGAVRGLRIFCP